MCFDHIYRDDEHLTQGPTLRTHLNCKTYSTDELKDFSKGNTFSLLHANIRSLTKHYDEFLSLLSASDYCYDIAGCTETWLREKSHLESLNIDGYNLYTKNRANTVGGGACLYVNCKYSVNRYFR